jgi:hypothetical protein
MIMGKTPKQRKPKETVLARQQADILKKSNAAWQSFYRPIMDKALLETSMPGSASPEVEAARLDVNRSFTDAKRQLGQSLSERGVEGGFEGSALAALQVAQANSTADAVANARLSQKNQQSNLLQLARAGSPQPTTAAPYA